MSGSVSGLSSSNPGYSVHSLDEGCCPAVVDKLTFYFTLGFIAAGTVYILTLLLVPLLFGGGRKRRSLSPLLSINAIELFPLGGEQKQFSSADRDIR